MSIGCNGPRSQFGLALKEGLSQIQQGRVIRGSGWLHKGEKLEVQGSVSTDFRLMCKLYETVGSG